MIEEQILIAWKDKHIGTAATDLCVGGVFQKKLYGNIYRYITCSRIYRLTKWDMYEYNGKVQEG